MIRSCSGNFRGVFFELGQLSIEPVSLEAEDLHSLVLWHGYGRPNVPLEAPANDIVSWALSAPPASSVCLRNHLARRLGVHPLLFFFEP